MDGTRWNENSSQLSKHPCHRIHGPGVLDQFNIRSDDFLLVLFSADLAGVFWFSEFVSELFVDGFRLRNALYGFCPYGFCALQHHGHCAAFVGV